MPAKPFTSGFTPSRLLASAPLFATLLPLVCMLPALGNGFLIWDDNVNLLSNPPLWQPGGSAYRWMFTDIESVQRYKPLAWLTWRLIGDTFGLNPIAFHAWNILLHAGNSWLLFRVIRNFLSRNITPPESRPMAASLAALAGTLSWAIHPLRVEPVAWISGAGYPLSTFFALLAVLTFQQQLQDDRSHFRWGALIFFVLSLLSYPAAAALPGLLLARAWLSAPQRGTFTAANFRWLIRVLAPYVVMAAAVLGVTLATRLSTSGEIWNHPASLHYVGLGPRLMQAFAAWVWYLEKTLLPLHLSPVYPDFWTFSATGLRSIASLMACVAISTGVWLLRRRWPEAPVFWGAFLLLAVPVLGIADLPFSPADRYTYVPNLAFALLFASLVYRSFNSMIPRVRFAVSGATGLVLAACLWGTLAQLAIWRTPVSFFQHAIATVEPNPAAADLHWRLGLHYLTMGEPQLAQAEFVTTLRLNPRQADAARYLRVLRQRAVPPINRTPSIESQGGP